MLTFAVGCADSTTVKVAVLPAPAASVTASPIAAVTGDRSSVVVQVGDGHVGGVERAVTCIGAGRGRGGDAERHVTVVGRRR